MKKKILAILLCFCAIILCGCASPVEYSFYQDPEGRYVEVAYIPFSLSELRTFGVEENTILTIQDTIVSRVYNYYQEQKISFVNRVNKDETLTDEEKAILKSQYNKNVNDVYISPIAQGDNKIATAGVVIDTNYIKFSLRYDSALCYLMAKTDYSYQGLLEYLENDETEVVEGFWTNKEIVSDTSIFNSQVDETRNLSTFILNYCEGILKSNTSLTDEQIASLIPSEFLYRYGSNTPRLHSNADKTFTDGGVYFHEWTFSTEKDAEGQSEVETKLVETWTVHANKNIWYAIALGGVVILVAVLFVIEFVKNRKNKHDKPEDKQIEIL